MLFPVANHWGNGMPEDLDEMARADALLSATHEGIRGLIKEGLEGNRYAVVAKLAEIADGIANIQRRAADIGIDDSRSDAPEGRRRNQADARSTPAVPPVALTARPRAENIPTYPRFEREGDRLVKIGWSKKDDREYEHKAPRSAVNAVCSALAKRGKRAPSLTMDTLLPVKDEEGQEVPSYQAYLVVAWLRQLGIVERTGKDGYSVNAAQVVPEEIETQWSSLPKYEAKV